MDGYSIDELPEEYTALSDRGAVMAEVMEALDSARYGTRKLGDVLVAAGLPARSWLGADARLRLLDEALPDVTLDDVITRLAEFSAGMGPGWLHGDSEAIERFNDEVALLDDVARVLRLLAQRERMASPRERSDLPMRRALGDARVGTQLDLLASDLRDLVALGPYLAPLSTAEWAALSGDRSVDQTPASAAPPQPPVVEPPPEFESQPRRLRDFAPSTSVSQSAVRAPVLSQRLGEAFGRMRVHSRALAERIMPRKWLALGAVALVLVVATALLSLASAPSHPSAPPLTASPAALTLHCSAHAASAKVTLRNAAPNTVSWSIAPPPGVQISSTRGALKPGATAALTITAHGAKPGKGTLSFISGSGNAAVAYSVTCP